MFDRGLFHGEQHLPGAQSHLKTHSIQVKASVMSLMYRQLIRPIVLQPASGLDTALSAAVRGPHLAVGSLGMPQEIQINNTWP